MNEIASSSTPPAAQPAPLAPTPRFTALHEAFLAKPGYGIEDIVEAHELAENLERENSALVAALRIAETFVRSKAQFFGSTHECGNLDCATCDENRTLAAIRKALAGEPLPAPDPSRAALVAALRGLLDSPPLEHLVKYPNETLIQFFRDEAIQPIIAARQALALADAAGKEAE